MSYEDIKVKAVESLLPIDPSQPLGTALFTAVAKVSVSVANEAVALRQGKQGIEIFLVSQTLDNPTFPGYLHCPGSIKRPGEYDKDVFRRLGEKEFHAPIKNWEKVAEWDNPRMDPRGHTFHRIFLVEVEVPHQPEEGGWFLVDNLPPNTMPYHRTHIIRIGVLAWKLKELTRS